MRYPQRCWDIATTVALLAQARKWQGAQLAALQEYIKACMTDRPKDSGPTRMHEDRILAGMPKSTSCRPIFFVLLQFTWPPARPWLHIVYTMTPWETSTFTFAALQLTQVEHCVWKKGSSIACEIGGVESPISPKKVVASMCFFFSAWFNNCANCHKWFSKSVSQEYLPTWTIKMKTYKRCHGIIPHECHLSAPNRRDKIARRK